MVIFGRLLICTQKDVFTVPTHVIIKKHPSCGRRPLAIFESQHPKLSLESPASHTSTSEIASLCDDNKEAKP